MRGKWWAAVAALAILTIIAAVISYEHTYFVFRLAHNTGAVAILGPVVPDLVIAVATMSLLEAASSGAERPRLAIVALGGFIVVTIALNVAAGLHYGRGSALLAALAPIGYLVGVHILASMMRRGRAGTGLGPTGAGPAASSLHTATVATPTREWLDRHLRAFREGMSEREVAEVLGISRGRVATATMSPPAPAGSPQAGAGVTTPNGSRPA